MIHLSADYGMEPKDTFIANDNEIIKGLHIKRKGLIHRGRIGVSRALATLARWVGPKVTIRYEPRPLSEYGWCDRDGNPIDPPPDCDENPEKYGYSWLKGLTFKR